MSNCNTIFLGSDHNGVTLKARLKHHLENKGLNCVDMGPFDSILPTDYVDIAFQVATTVAKSKHNRGILICGTGQGMSIAANKIPQIRAALVHNMTSAKKSREHNDANILCLGSWINSDNKNISLTMNWLQEPFGAGRHTKRVEKIKKFAEKTKSETSFLPDMRHEVYKAHMTLYKNNLVCCSNGNVSARCLITNRVVIKPSGILYEDLSPENLVVVDLDGKVLSGDHKPSVDTLTHLYIYKNYPNANAIVHTHSPYATAFAAIGKEIPVALTEIADSFGSVIPCGKYVSVGSEKIGKEVLKHLTTSPVVLMKHHGLFAVGQTADEAVQKAIKVEGVAQTVYLASQLGTIQELPQSEIIRAHNYYKSSYGQQKKLEEKCLTSL